MIPVRPPKFFDCRSGFILTNASQFLSVPASATGDITLEALEVIIFATVVLAPAVIAFVWGIWEGWVLPALVPKSEITALANDLIEEYGVRAGKIAANREYEGWYRSELTDQGRWRRVRREINRR